ncbi:MAG TPA: GxxExxY protein, partial [Allosphingosinicella sp.]|nr:GxxExxY protein [Allosphingosinicella sp.]
MRLRRRDGRRPCPTWKNWRPWQSIIEVKAIDRLAAVHSRQVLTYLKLLDLPLGLV